MPDIETNITLPCDTCGTLVTKVCTQAFHPWECEAHLTDAGRIAQYAASNEDTPGVCPENPVGVHTPDWSTVYALEDGDAWYLDVHCQACGRSGCIGNVRDLVDNISWE